MSSLELSLHSAFVPNTGKMRSGSIIDVNVNPLKLQVQHTNEIAQPVSPSPLKHKSCSLFGQYSDIATHSQQDDLDESTGPMESMPTNLLSEITRTNTF